MSDSGEEENDGDDGRSTHGFSMGNFTDQFKLCAFYEFRLPDFSW